jgi:hypothetical protein
MMHRTTCLGPVLSRVQYWRIRALPLIVQKPSAIQESRSAKSSKRRRRNFRHKSRYTRVAWRKVGGGTMERNLAFPRLSRVSHWDNLSLRPFFIRPCLRANVGIQIHTAGNAVCFFQKPSQAPHHVRCERYDRLDEKL